jgi:ribosomal protein L37AE/L43A
VESGIKIGKFLSESRGLLPGGEPFKAWVERECGCSISSAYNYISAFENFGECPNLDCIELSAMYELTKNKSAKKAALEMAKRGKIVTLKIAKELVSKNKAKSNGKPVEVTVSIPQAGKESARATEPENGKQTRSQTVAAPAADSETEETETPRNGSPTEGDSQPTDTCPVCAGKKWVEGKFGWECKKCSHIHSEPAGDPDEQRIKDQRSKTVKTAEALLREFDDLNVICPNKNHTEAIRLTKAGLKLAKEWK